MNQLFHRDQITSQIQLLYFFDHMPQTLWSLTSFLVKSFNHWPAFWWSLSAWWQLCWTKFLAAFHLMADLISTWRLWSSLFTCIDIALTWRTCSKPAITSSVTLSALCWILHGHIDLVTPSLFMAMGGKLQNEYAHTCMHAYLKGGGYGRFKGASGWGDGMVEAAGFTAWNIRAMWITCLCVRACMCVCELNQSSGRKGCESNLQHRRHNTQTISEPAHITQALVTDRHA